MDEIRQSRMKYATRMKYLPLANDKVNSNKKNPFQIERILSLSSALSGYFTLRSNISSRSDFSCCFLQQTSLEFIIKMNSLRVDFSYIISFSLYSTGSNLAPYTCSGSLCEHLIASTTKSAAILAESYAPLPFMSAPVNAEA